MKKLFKTSMFFVLCATKVLATCDSIDDELPPISLEMRAINAEDAPHLERIMQNCYQEGLPASAESYTTNMLKRAETGNPFTCYFFNDSTNPETTHAAVGFGRMPITGYKAEEHSNIINFFISLDVLRKKDELGGLDETNLERIENRGLGVMLPMLPLELSLEYKLCVLEEAKNIFKNLSMRNSTLPLENTRPHQLITLLHPEDTLVPLMTQAGFTLTEKEGFEKFYNKPRVVLHTTL